MAWHAPLVYADGVAYDQDDFNEQLGENLDFLYDAPTCFVYLAANQSITNNTTVAVEFENEDGDTHGMHDNVSNQARITITTAGRYWYGASIGFEANAVGLRRLSIEDQGGSTRARKEIPEPSGYLDAWLNCGGFHTMAATNWIRTTVHQISGGARNATEDSCFWAHWMGAV